LLSRRCHPEEAQASRSEGLPRKDLCIFLAMTLDVHLALLFQFPL
jgi:hypothetical protein